MLSGAGLLLGVTFSAEDEVVGEGAVSGTGLVLLDAMELFSCGGL